MNEKKAYPRLGLNVLQKCVRAFVISSMRIHFTDNKITQLNGFAVVHFMRISEIDWKFMRARSRTTTLNTH